jgi:FlaA1/EpsC-like NDP-sugar epimerase
MRLARRLYAELSTGRHGKRVLVYGAGNAGELIVRDMKSNHAYRPIGFIDDDVTKVGRRIHGVPVLGTRNDVPKILDRYRPREVLVAIPSAAPAELRAIVRSLESFNIPIKTLPNLRDLVDGKIDVATIRSLSVEDLLARVPVGLDPAPVRALIAGRRVMVTGAGGSIGSELCRQIATLRPASLVMFDRYENSLHAIRLELEDVAHRFGLHAVIGDVTDGPRVASVMQRFSPEIIFHAAAHKHVPLMEENPCEAFKNNVRGTRLVAEAAEAYGVDRFIFISTDKAVNPTSVMGASKRIAELVVQAQASGSGTSFAIVRFGNVLGSNGSVVPRFVEQIRNGGPVTVTDPEMRRFFMLIPEAVQLVLHAASQAESGATYVLEMGEQIKVVDMARDLIRLAGLVPDEDIKIEFIGLRPGEKLYEELVGNGEEASESTVDKVLCVRSRLAPSPGLLADVRALEDDAFAHRTDLVLAAVKRLAGTFGAGAEEGVPAVAPVHVPPLVAIRDMDDDQRLCPVCHTGRPRRSHARTMTERVKKRFTAERPHRCDECGWRGWRVPLEFGVRVPASATHAPDLASLDEAFGPAAAHRPEPTPAARVASNNCA